MPRPNTVVLKYTMTYRCVVRYSNIFLFNNLRAKAGHFRANHRTAIITIWTLHCVEQRRYNGGSRIAVPLPSLRSVVNSIHVSSTLEREVSSFVL